MITPADNQAYGDLRRNYLDQIKELTLDFQDQVFTQGLKLGKATAPGLTVQLGYTRDKRVYLAGPMTGLPEYNFPAFNAEAERLRSTGLHVENPADHGIVPGAEWEDYMRYDLGRLVTCEAIHFLPGWSQSPGAILEQFVARSLGMTITYAEGAEQE